MAESAYITLVEGSTKQALTLDDLKQELHHYIDMTTKTGEQVEWNYSEMAFPYSIEQKPEGQGKWFYLQSKEPKLYRNILVGVKENEAGQTQVQITIPENALQGDKSKANELSRYFAKHFKAELTLFNGRVQFFNPRK